MFVFRILAHMQGHAFGHLYTRRAQRFHFVGIIGQQPDAPYAQMGKNLLCQTEIAGIDRQTQSQIGLHRIQALILQAIGTDFIDQTNAAPLLPQVGNRPAAFTLHRLHRSLKLRAAVALARKQCISGQTFGMHPCQYRKAV